MESTELLNYHIAQINSFVKKEDDYELWKYLLLCAKDIQEQGIAGQVLKLIAANRLGVDPVIEESEYN